MTETPLPRLITLGETLAVATTAASLASADDVRLRVVGAESAVAARAVRLGIPTAWIGAVGDDPLGVRVRDDIARRGVDVRWATVDPDAATGVCFAEPGRAFAYRAGSAALRMSPTTVADVPLEDVEAVHLTGLTPALSHSCAALVDTVVDRVSAGHGILSFDVRHKADLWEPGTAAPALLALARRADLVFVGLDEAAELWDARDADAVRELIPRPTRLVVKDASGATEFHRYANADVRSFAPAGAARASGDAFAAGYLAATLQGADAGDRLSAGHRAAE